MKIIFVYVANEVYKHFWSLVLGSVKISECTRRYIVNINLKRFLFDAYISFVFEPRFLVLVFLYFKLTVFYIYGFRRL